VDEAPAGEDWVHELKFDGYRILCRIDGGKVSLLTRNGKDWTDAFAPVAAAAARLPCTRALLDGEAAVVLPDGTTSFNALQNAMEEGSRERLAYFAFDLLHLDGQDLTRAPLEERKAALAELVGRAGPAAAPIRYSDHVTGTGPAFFEQACRMKLEGIICKRLGEPYRSGRGRGWLKVKCVAEQEFVIGGFTDPEGQRGGIGALLLGVHEGGRLRFAGKVGTGFSEKSARELRRKLDALEVDRPPFAARPAGVKGAHWVRPELVAEVKFSEWTPDGKLRHPSFQGLREDKKAAEIVREEPAAPAARKKAGGAKAAAARRSASVKRPARQASARKAAVARPLRSAREREAWDEVRAGKARRGQPQRDRQAAPVTVSGVRLTHPDRVLYPGQGITKRTLAGFYESIADWILPHLAGRPTTLVRCPEGVGEPCFYQKHTGSWAPASLRRVKIQEKTKVGEYLVVDDLPGLIGLVQLGILEIHTWNSSADHLEQPDRIVFDLDPAPDVPWARVVEAARLLREELAAEKLESFVKTTGGKGLHVVVPLVRGPSWDDCLDYSRRLAERIAAERPREFLAEMSKARRVGRIFIDYLRNLRGSTSVSAYSTRARPGAPVSAPLRWDELSARTRPDEFTVETLSARLASLREDPWKGYGRLRQRLPELIRTSLRSRSRTRSRPSR
jgi:bifunctional non-homologous end joining protein LigD